ncbi:hypothetical protein O181_053750 [Austropuccinia psidii MF-1]|uniref:Uncharacterized protein n=1 Tax=Austropuccinia psidii MF-1 TaxID=1389203 RepID=A0A9Q3E165_9BASI|nr:hypothetical protein [Austropuccinia psidii MF-1]
MLIITLTLQTTTHPSFLLCIGPKENSPISMDTAKDAFDRMVYMEVSGNHMLEQHHQNTRQYIMRLITLTLNLLNFDIRPRDGPWIMTHFCSTLMILTHHLAFMNAEIEDARDNINCCHL